MLMMIIKPTNCNLWHGTIISCLIIENECVYKNKVILNRYKNKFPKNIIVFCFGSIFYAPAARRQGALCFTHAHPSSPEFGFHSE